MLNPIKTTSASKMRIRPKHRTTMRALALILSLSVFAGAAHAEQGPGPQITVVPGALLRKKAASYGQTEVDYLMKTLTRDVTRAVSRSASPPVRIDLVIEDAEPNRPTAAQLQHDINLSPMNLWVGGAQISGTVTKSDGSVHLLRYQYYEEDLQEEVAADTWNDAERVFDKVSGQIVSGRLSTAYIGPGPTAEGGRFGYPYHN